MTELNLITSVRDLHIAFGSQVVMDEISFDIGAGEFIYLIGKTGSGKSSILKTLYADLAVQSGYVKVADFLLHKIEPKQLPVFRRKLGIIFQDFELFMDRSVEENLKFVMRATGWQSEPAMDSRIMDLFELVDLEGVQEKFPHQLSGGEQQRVAIARALLNDPDLILADEPTGNLDPIVANEILKLFVEINKTGTAILMGTHQHNFLRTHPARVLLCENQTIKDIDKRQVAKRLL